MLSLHKPRERETSGWQQLFREADARFGVLKIGLSEGAALAIIETIWQD